MGVATKKLANKKFLQDLVPLNALSENRFAEVSGKIVVEEVRKGRYLFRKGDRDNESIYLLDGKINLIDGFRKVTAEVEGGTDMSRYPIANQQPRPLSARAETRVVIARIDSGLLDVFLTWDQSTSAEVTDISSDEDQDWMTRLLQSDAFARIPPAVIQRLLMKMEKYPARAGQEIIRQGDEGDYFYTIHQGQCAVTRRDTPEGELVKLAELSDGDSFGEEALVSDVRRNASVTMLTDGVLMRLAKQDFVDLLQRYLVSNIGFEEASTLVDAGAVWVDVRSAGEYEAGSFEDSVNIPLADLRGELPELVYSVKYILCCDTGRRSASAAFILSHKGYEVYVLDGGMNALAEGAMVPGDAAGQAPPVDHPDEPVAEVIDFHDARTPGGPDTASSGAPGPAGAVSAPDVSGEVTAEWQEQITRLHEENAGLRQALGDHEHTAVELAERNAETGQLGAALRAAQEQLAGLRREHDSGTEELRLVREQYAALQEEYSGRVAQLEKQLAETANTIDRLHEETGVASREQEQMQEQAAAQRQAEQEARDALATERESAARQLEALQSELAAARREAAARLDESIAALDEQRQQAAELRSDLGHARQQTAALEAELGILRKEKQGADASIQGLETEYHGLLEGLRQELREAGEQITGLESELGTLRSEQRESGAQAEAARQEITRQLDSAHAELEAAQHRVGELEAGIATAREEQAAAVGQATAEQDRLAGELDALRSELDQLRQENAGLSGLLADADGKLETWQQQQTDLETERETEHEEHRQRHAELQQRLEALQEAHRGELERLEAERETEREEHRQRHAELQQQLEALQEAHRGDLERLEAEVSGREAASERLREADRQQDSLRAENRDLEERIRQLQEDLENAITSGQAAEAALQHRQADAATERDDLQGEVNDRQRQLEEARNQVQQLQERLETETARHGEELHERIGTFNEQLERQELLYQELKQQYSEREEQLLAVTTERYGFQKQHEEAEQHGAVLQQEIDKLNEQIAALTATADEKTRMLGEQLEGAQQEYRDLQQQSTEQAGRIESLLQEAEQKDTEFQELQGQANGLQSQCEDLRRELQEAEERSKQRDLDNEVALNRAYDDLGRKNESEKELQAQLVRLRKKLEQSAGDLQAARDEARDSAEHFREELQAERRSRAQERSELAARQKQLKEQLAAISGEHEELLAAQRGDKSRSGQDGNPDVHLRLEQELAWRSQAEEQLAALQRDLEKAHAEIAEAVQQERDRGTADLTLAREQKTEADTAIAQLEVRLRQLTDERDAAVGEQQAVREQLNALRAEVEVARGLMNAAADGQLDDPVKLRAELEESRRNTEIAVRLRSEAEARRDEALQQMEALRAGHESGGDMAVPMAIPSLDETAAVPEKRKKPARGAVAAETSVTVPHVTPGSALPGGDAVQGGYAWLGKAIGLTAAGIAALVFWVLLRTENPLTGVMHVLDDAGPAVATVPVTSPEQPPAEPAPEPAAAVPEAPADAVGATAGAAAVEPAGEPAPQEPAEPVAVTPVRSYRDALHGGGKGPWMVELPASGFLMGSPGNSLNFEERPQHRVDLKGFSVGRNEVTFADYDRFARATGRRLPYDEGWGRGDQPVINVSWKDAVAYAQWLSDETGHDYRLPTEAQWEFAARGGSSRQYWWGDNLPGTMANCFDCGSRWDGSRTTAVGSFQPNGFGLFDTAGNVQEWVEDCYVKDYDAAAADGSVAYAPHCTQRVVRGGSYTSPVDRVRSAARGQYDHDTRLDNLGFRVVRVN